MTHPGWSPLWRCAALACAIAALGACGGTPDRPQRATAREAPLPVAREIPREGLAAVWRLRAGLNVAALTCRGRGMAAVAPGYRQLLSRHSALFARAHAEEQRRQGVAGFDRAQTRYYNRMANQRSPVRFCATATGIAGQANALDSPRLAAAAPRLATDLENAVR